MKRDTLVNIVLSALVGVILLVLGWIKSDIDRLNTKIDQLTSTYIEVVGELHNAVNRRP